MALGYKVFNSGFNDLIQNALVKDVASGLTATGSSQSDALQVTSQYNGFTTVAASTGAILDSQSAAGDWQVIYNGGANTLKVYPISGASINAGATNAAYSLPAGVAMVFYCISTTLFVTFGTLSTRNSPLTVPDGGTGLTSATAYAVLCGGTTSTGAFQSIAGVGTSGQVLTSNGASALPTFQTLTTSTTTVETPKATTSGTNVEWTSLPSGIKWFTVSYNGNSTNSTSAGLVQIGDGSGGLKTSGYAGGSGDRAGEATTTAGFMTVRAYVAARTYNGMFRCVLEDSTNFKWVGSFSGGDSNGFAFTSGGNVTLTAALDRVRVTTVTPDTFDAGEVGLQYGT